MSGTLRERVARVLAELAPGEDWPTNAALGGNLTGTRDDEFRAAMYGQADAVLAELGLTEEWGVRWTGRNSVFATSTEATARRMAARYPDDYTLVRRHLTPWTEVET